MYFTYVYVCCDNPAFSAAICQLKYRIVSKTRSTRYYRNETTLGWLSRRRTRYYRNETMLGWLALLPE